MPPVVVSYTIDRCTLDRRLRHETVQHHGD
jgi:hypothetical protein